MVGESGTVLSLQDAGMGSLHQITLKNATMMSLHLLILQKEATDALQPALSSMAGPVKVLLQSAYQMFAGTENLSLLRNVMIQTSRTGMAAIQNAKSHVTSIALR